MRVLHLIFATWIFLTLADCCNAKAWRGIIPLKSTRADVERLLGPPTVNLPRYYLPDSTVDFQYSSCRCGEKCKNDEWNVPPDTVIVIRVGMKGVVKLADLNIDLTNFRKVSGAEDLPSQFYYENEEEGFAIDTGGGYVSALIYGPRAKDNHLRCPRTASIDAGRKFDQYGLLTLKEEKNRLDNLAAQLKKEPLSKGYVVMYEGSEDHIRDLKARACRATQHLVTRRGVEPKRIVAMLVKGDNRERFSVELWIWPVEGPDDLPRFQMGVDPKDVSIIRVTETAKKCPSKVSASHPPV